MDFKLENDYITLSQLLKACDFIYSGGQAKFFLQEHKVYVNGQPEQRRGKKLYKGDCIQIDEQRIEIR
ncbi:MAG: S4 domain-containing protein YaaA [Faecalicoccus sp.]|jgi:S4 domain protein YaaA|nr:S4 domain-containing protein YaaA [Faecalicoccus sp.]